MLKIFIIFFLSFITGTLSAQPDSNDSVPHFNTDSLKKIYGIKKKLLSPYELQTLVALTYYPELLNDHIRFKYAHVRGTAQTTVTLGSLFKRINKRYIIYINDDIKKTGILLGDAPFDAQVAVVGHEFAHVADFKTRGFFEMVWWGINYLFVKQRAKIEIRTDKSTIRHGLGWSLYNWSDFVLNHSKANERYKKIRRTKYLQPDEIISYIKKYEPE